MYFQKVLKYQIFVKIPRVAAKLFHAEGRTDKRTYMTNLVVASRHIANAAKMRGIILSFYHTRLHGMELC